MSITINLNPELEASLLERASASGMTIEEYVLSIVAAVALPVDQPRLTGEERAAAFIKWANGHRDDGPLLSDYAVSRESMYNDK